MYCHCFVPRLGLPGTPRLGLSGVLPLGGKPELRGGVTLVQACTMKKGFLLAPVAPLNREDSSDSEGVIVKSPEEIGTQAHSVNLASCSSRSRLVLFVQRRSKRPRRRSWRHRRRLH